MMNQLQNSNTDIESEPETKFIPMPLLFPFRRKNQIFFQYAIAISDLIMYNYVKKLIVEVIL